jgi:fructose-bisphosphate aldolase class 1
MPWKGIKKLFNALERNQKAIQCLKKESESHPMPWKLIKKLSNALKKNQKAIQCLGKE